MTTLSPDTVRRIEDAAAALIAAGIPNPTNEQVRQHLGGGSLSHISPVMRAFRARQREQAAKQATPLPTELAVLREVVAERDRLLQEVRELRAEALPLREQVARLTATGEHLAAQLQDTKTELKEAREDGRQLQTELLALARQDGKVKK
ncbi:DNA-binding protein [Enterobacter bugandensis]|uniref:DNA-binding protein n=1 Tax=Enterobacter bugandensis TaxID=881260 RepID=UPI002A8297B2|nr:DNA-binding protein [Enterobacter bugandensis]